MGQNLDVLCGKKECISQDECNILCLKIELLEYLLKRQTLSHDFTHLHDNKKIS